MQVFRLAIVWRSSERLRILRGRVLRELFSLTPCEGQWMWKLASFSKFHVNICAAHTMPGARESIGMLQVFHLVGCLRLLSLGTRLRWSSFLKDLRGRRNCLPPPIIQTLTFAHIARQESRSPLLRRREFRLRRHAQQLHCLGKSRLRRWLLVWLAQNELRIQVVSITTPSGQVFFKLACSCTDRFNLLSWQIIWTGHSLFSWRLDRLTAATACFEPWVLHDWGWPLYSWKHFLSDSFRFCN